MNPFLNPVLLFRSLNSYLVDPGRLRRISNEKLKKIQDNSLKKMVNYAYQIPLYHEKYKEAGVHPGDIRGIDDIKKLPFITKDDIRKYTPDKITPSNFNKETGNVSRTGGTTGEPLLIYFDLYTAIKAMIGFKRALNEYDVNWRKTKMSLLIDLSERSYENEYFINSTSSAIKPLFSQKNIQIFDLFKTSAETVKRIDEFQPEFIAGYPFALLQLAILKNKGFGKNIRPKCILSSGSYFDSYSKKFVEEAVGTKIYDFYAATESGPIAFECKNGNYHVYSDLIYPEFLVNDEDVSPGEPGNLVLTKLYGRGTPLIRYTGIDDVVTLGKGCSCGLAGESISRIHGRRSNSILLPDGKMALTSLFDDIIGEVISETKANKISRIQIIQHRLDKIEIRVLFDKELRDVGATPEEIFGILKRKLSEKMGSEIQFVIKEVDKFKAKDPYLICKIDRAKFVEKSYLF